MAEFVVAAPVMILLWFGVSYFRQGYARRLQTMSDAHADAWAKAYSNDGSCFRAGAGPWQGWTSSAGSGLVDGNGNQADVADKFKGTSSLFIYGSVRSKATRKTEGAYWNGSTSSQSFITCNEVVPTGYYADQDVVTPLWDFAGSFFKF
jgi:hypothetical protein